MKMNLTRTFWIRLAAIIVVLLFSVFLFFIGKQHTVLLDNKTVTVDGTEIRAMQLVEVQVNDIPSLELAARDRDKVEVTSQSHQITITYTDDAWEEHVLTRKFKVPVMQDMVMVLLPVLVANPEADQALWLENYEVPTYAVTAEPVEEEVVTDDLAALVSDI